MNEQDNDIILERVRLSQVSQYLEGVQPDIATYTLDIFTRSNSQETFLANSINLLAGKYERSNDPFVIAKRGRVFEEICNIYWPVNEGEEKEKGLFYKSLIPRAVNTILAGRAAELKKSENEDSLSYFERIGWTLESENLGEKIISDPKLLQSLKLNQYGTLRKIEIPVPSEASLSGNSLGFKNTVVTPKEGRKRQELPNTLRSSGGTIPEFDDVISLDPITDSIEWSDGYSLHRIEMKTSTIHYPQDAAISGVQHFINKYGQIVPIIFGGVFDGASAEVFQSPINGHHYQRLNYQSGLLSRELANNLPKMIVSDDVENYLKNSGSLEGLTSGQSTFDSFIFSPLTNGFVHVHNPGIRKDYGDAAISTRLTGDRMMYHDLHKETPINRSTPATLISIYQTQLIMTVFELDYPVAEINFCTDGFRDTKKIDDETRLTIKF